MKCVDCKAELCFHLRCPNCEACPDCFEMFERSALMMRGQKRLRDIEMQPIRRNGEVMT